MSLFPRYGGAHPANTAKVAKVGAAAEARDYGPRISNFRDFSGPAPLGSQPPDCANDIVQRVADLVDAWHERMAICLEAGDIGEAEAELTAALEIGQAFVRIFVRDTRGGPK